MRNRSDCCTLLRRDQLSGSCNVYWRYQHIHHYGKYRWCCSWCACRFISCFQSFAFLRKYFGFRICVIYLQSLCRTDLLRSSARKLWIWLPRSLCQRAGAMWSLLCIFLHPTMRWSFRYTEQSYLRIWLYLCFDSMTKRFVTGKNGRYVPYQVLQGPCPEQNCEQGKKSVQYTGYLSGNIRCPSMTQR